MNTPPLHRQPPALRVLKEAGAFEWLAICGMIVALNVAAIPENLAALPDVPRLKIGMMLVWDTAILIALTPGLFWLFDRLPIRRGLVLRNSIARVLVVAAAPWVPAAAIVASARAFSGPLELPPDLVSGPDFRWTEMYRDAVGFVILALFAYTWTRRLLERQSAVRRAADLEAALLRARLHALSAELQPHFLFNTLNGIAELIREAPDRAEEMLINLSELLRLSLRGANTEGIPLRDELASLDVYIRIQGMRLGERVSFQVSVDPNVLAAKVPAMLLQPIVENAITHGIGPQSGPGTVEVRARKEGDHVLITVADDGVGLGPDAGEGLGLSNTRERLAASYGEDGRLEVLESHPTGTEVRLRLPFEPSTRSPDRAGRT